MEAFSALLVLCAGNSPVTGEFPSQRPVTRSFDVFFNLRLNKRLRKQSPVIWRNRAYYAVTVMMYKFDTCQGNHFHLARTSGVNFLGYSKRKFDAQQYAAPHQNKWSSVIIWKALATALCSSVNHELRSTPRTRFKCCIENCESATSSPW